jgi:hypothetical protein
MKMIDAWSIMTCCRECKNLLPLVGM